MSNRPLPKFKLEIGNIINSYNRKLKIINREYRPKIAHSHGREFTSNEKWYQYECLECGNKDWIVETALCDNQHIGCNVCSTRPKKVAPGINDIATTAPWMVKYFGNPEDATKYTKTTKQVIEFTCPDCGRKHYKSIGSVYTSHNLSCPCQDGWSYPNKFMYSILEQAGVNFESEKLFDWSNDRRYDDYIEYNGLKIITEQHGKQHYEREINKDSRTVEEEQENDKMKHNLAIQNGIDYYFIIDCRESTKEYIQNSVLNSGLFSILNINPKDIDFNKCDEFATSNIVKQFCNYKNEHPEMTIREIAPLFHIVYGTGLKWVKKRR